MAELLIPLDPCHSPVSSNSCLQFWLLEEASSHLPPPAIHLHVLPAREHTATCLGRQNPGCSSGPVRRGVGGCIQDLSGGRFCLLSCTEVHLSTMFLALANKVLCSCPSCGGSGELGPAIQGPWHSPLSILRHRGKLCPPRMLPLGGCALY